MSGQSLRCTHKAGDLSSLLMDGEYSDQTTWMPIEPRHEKTNVLVSYLVRHKPGCTATEDG